MRRGIRFLAALVVMVFMLLFNSTIVFSQGSSDKFNMSYIYYGNSSMYTGIVSKTNGSLDDIAPSYFDINTNGTLKLTLAVDKNFVNQMHDRGIKVTPFLSNHWDRDTGISALKNKALLVSQIVDAIAVYDLDGVNVDLENLTENERGSYTDLLRLLRQGLPAGKSLSIAVAANPYKETTDWQGSYDFAALSNYCDYLMLMTYDEHYQGGDEGPVASATIVENSIKAALKDVPKEKLVLGIAFYGRLWKQGTTYGGYGISNNVIESLINKYKGTVAFDSVSKSPKAVITIKAGDVKPVVNGMMLDTGTYDIWFENEDSIKNKLQLVKKYDIKGTGSWSLGQETESTWDYYRLWLNGTYFYDIDSNWAKQSILYVANKGWMIGVNGTEFKPGAVLTRAQAAVTLVRALGLSNSVLETSGGAPFSDTANHWAQKEIEIARQYNIVKGEGGSFFAPDSPVTREQMAVMLERVLQGLRSAEIGYQVFPDVNSAYNFWSYDAISKMALNNIIQGYPDGKFHPLDKITRGQMAALMERSSGYMANGVVIAQLP